MIILDRASFDKGIAFAADIIENRLADIVVENPLLIEMINTITYILRDELRGICKDSQLIWGGEEIDFLKGGIK